MPDQRLGSLSQLALIHETSLDTPAGEAYLWPLHGPSEIGSDRGLIEVPIFKANFNPFASVLGIANVTGGIPTTGDFLFIGRIARVVLGLGSYTKANEAGGTKAKHRYAPATPESITCEAQFTEAPADYIRDTGIKLGGFDFASEQEGGIWYTVNATGSGRETVATTPFDATPTDDAFQTVSYLDGRIVKGSTELADVTTFGLNLRRNLQRQGAFFNPYAAGINPGKFNASGTLGIAYKDLGFYNEASAGTLLALDCMYGDRDPALGFTQWIRFQFASVRFSRGTPRPGGEEGLNINQNFRMEPSSTGFSAEYIAENIETYNIGATSFNLGVKVDGGGTVTKVLTQGAARTAAQVVTDLQASGGIAGATSDRFGGNATANTGGRPRIRSNTFGPTSSIQIDTGVANSAHTVLGFDGVTRSGILAPFLMEILNTKTTTY